MTLRYTPQAVADLQAIKQYIRMDLGNPGAAKRISQMILGRCAQLKRFPEMGIDLRARTGLDTDLRMLVCENYAAVYRRDGNFISVARIFHMRQNFMRVLFDESDTKA